MLRQNCMCYIIGNKIYGLIFRSSRKQYNRLSPSHSNYDTRSMKKHVKQSVHLYIVTCLYITNLKKNKKSKTVLSAKTWPKKHIPRIQSAYCQSIILLKILKSIWVVDYIKYFWDGLVLMLLSILPKSSFGGSRKTWDKSLLPNQAPRTTPSNEGQTIPALFFNSGFKF